jgi:hypothetical protein
MINIKVHKKSIQNTILFFLFLVISPFLMLQATPVVVSGGPENDYESWIIRLKDNRLMAIFDRNPDWASGDLYVTFSTNNGNSWDPVQPIITDPGDQATLSFLQLPGDTIRLWYASNETGTYRIYSAYSLNGTDWTKEGQIDLGWAPSYIYYDPTVILESDSSLTMSYIVSGIGGHIAHCPYDSTWDTLKTLVATSGQRARVMKHTNSTYLFAYHRKSGPGQYDYDVFIRTSTDRVNWSDSVRLTYNLNSHDPFPNQTPDGAYLVYYAKYEFPAYNLHRRLSYNTTNWEPEEQITSDTTNNTQPHFFFEANEIYLIWAHAVSLPYDHDVYFERFLYPGVEESELEQRPISLSVHPNPCNTRIEISFSMGHRDERIELKIFDLAGRCIKNFPISNFQFPICIEWDGRDNKGNIVPNGTYFVKVNLPKGNTSRKFTVIR